ncbi:prephenate dehydratase [Candidatus Roizmanbacteria bacterium]|nr:prephenate dehydratase [Candidatus Roizmanbacteria bacterium]
MTIFYQGVPGSFSHLAAKKKFGIAASYTNMKTFRDVFMMVKKNPGTYGIIPIENTIAGSVYENYDHLYTYPVHVIDEIFLPVEHHLLAVPTGEEIAKRLKQITKVYSHIKAIEQCANYLEKHTWMEPCVAENTAVAAKHISETKDVHFAAIASKEAATLYNLQILDNNIEDDSSNCTRFLVINSKPQVIQDANKCSLIFQIAHQPGSLVEALKIVAENNINLTKIESRPIKNKPFEYLFYVDFEFSGHDLQSVEHIVRKIQKHTTYCKNLGFYQFSHS